MIDKQQDLGKINLDSVETYPQRLARVSEELSAVPFEGWGVYNSAKAVVGFTRSWNGINPSSPEVTNSDLLKVTGPGEVIIPTYTLAVPEKTWDHVSHEVINHISAITKLGSAILTCQRKGIGNGCLPTLEKLGFSDDEIDILLARPDIDDLFLLSRTDYSLEFDSNDKNPRMWRYETNSAQPGGAEVVDSFSMPDAVRGSLPIVSTVLENNGIENHRVLPTYMEAIDAFWEKYHAGEDIEGILVLSGGYSFGTELLIDQLHNKFGSSQIIAENTEAPRPLSEDRSHITHAAQIYADTIKEKFKFDENGLYYLNGRGEKSKVGMIIHEPRIDIEHLAALKDSDLIKAWKAGCVEIINPPQARVCGTKKLEALIMNNDVWSEMEELGYGLTEEEKETELRTTIRSRDLDEEAIRMIEDNGNDPKLVVKPGIAGSGRGIHMRRSYPDKESFIGAIRKAAGDGEPYIIMEEMLPGRSDIILHIPGAPQISALLDLNPYTVSIPGRNGNGPEIRVPGSVSRAHIPLTEEERQLAETQGIKLNVLGPDNNFIMQDGSKRQYMIAIGNVAVIGS